MASVTPNTELSPLARTATTGKLNYLDFFELKDPPFRNISNVSRLFLNAALGAARIQLDTALDQPDVGIFVVNGAPGSGKTTLVNDVVGHRTDKCQVAWINQTQLSENEFLRILLHAFGLRTEDLESAGLETDDLVKKKLLERFRDFLIRQEKAGRHLILVIDEAQNLKPEVLELLPLLLEHKEGTGTRFSIILIGQDAFARTLAMSGGKRLRELIRYQTYLTTLSHADTWAYIGHQLVVAGNRRDNPFTERAMSQIHRHTAGSMRLINTLCDFVLFNAYLGRIRKITPELVQTTFNALQWESTKGATERLAVLDDGVDGQIPKLILEFEDNSEYPLDRDSVTIGRAGDNDIAIRDLRISRYHAKLSVTPGGVSIEDLGSTNGVYVNEERVKLRRLRDGDLIMIDDNRLRFVNRSES